MDVIQGFLTGFDWDTIIKTGLRITLPLISAWLAMKLLQNLFPRLEKILFPFFSLFLKTKFELVMSPFSMEPADVLEKKQFSHDCAW